MGNKLICSICNEGKELTEYYLKPNGNRKSAKCKSCYCKKQYEYEKVSPVRLRYIENKRAINKVSSQKRIESLAIHKANRNKIKELNKQLSIANIKHKQSQLKINKTNYYKSIALKYNTTDQSIIKEWRDIKGYEGLYKVSNHGEVYSCKRNRLLSIIIESTHGYARVNLYNNKRKTHKVHRLVLESFSININNKEEINHIDSDRTNNKINNLEWSTRKENTDHRICNSLNLIT
jgi:hypothetical protein